VWKLLIDFALRQVLGIVRAFAYIHTRTPPIVHGDAVTRNVLIGPGETPLLCDFGFSRIRHEVTRTRTTIRAGGRDRFLAPELSSDTDEFRPSPASDIFSLALTFWNVWTGEYPFPERSDMGAMAALRRGERPPRPRGDLDILPGTMGSFWALIQTMWGHEAAGRPTATEVLAEMEEIFGTLMA